VNNVTHARLREALSSLCAAAAGTGAPQQGAGLVELLFGRRPARPVPPAARPLKPLNASLDASQLSAVALALAAPELALIHAVRFFDSSHVLFSLPRRSATGHGQDHNGTLAGGCRGVTL